MLHDERIITLFEKATCGYGRVNAIQVKKMLENVYPGLRVWNKHPGLTRYANFKIAVYITWYHTAITVVYTNTPGRFKLALPLLLKIFKRGYRETFRCLFSKK